MARLSEVSAISAIQPSEALEWIVGDAAVLRGTVGTDATPSVPQSLTGVTLSCRAEFYKATLTTVSRRGTLAVTAIARDTTRTAKTLTVTPDSDQSTNPGRFTLTIPSDLYPGDQPEVNLSTEVPVGLVYLTQTRSATDKRTTRFIIVFRRGAP